MRDKMLKAFANCLCSQSDIFNKSTWLQALMNQESRFTLKHRCVVHNKNRVKGKFMRNTSFNPHNRAESTMDEKFLLKSSFLILSQINFDFSKINFNSKWSKTLQQNN